MNNIFKRQNDQDMLDVLYAQRQYYNMANCLEYANLIIMFIIYMVNLIGVDSEIIQILVNIIMVFVNVLIAKIIERNIKNGANLKKYFDYSLFGFDIDTDFKKKCLGLVYNIKKRRNYKYQINSDGKSKKPGLKNWYFDENYISKVDQIKSAQFQNKNWDALISNIYIIILLLGFIIMITIYIIAACIREYSVLKLIAGVVPLSGFFAYLVTKIKSYIFIYRNTEIISYSLKKAKTKEDLLEIQSMIDKRRYLNFSPPNIIHKLVSKKQHEKYEYINNNK